MLRITRIAPHRRSHKKTETSSVVSVLIPIVTPVTPSKIGKGKISNFVRDDGRYLSSYSRNLSSRFITIVGERKLIKHFVGFELRQSAPGLLSSISSRRHGLLSQLTKRFQHVNFGVFAALAHSFFSAAQIGIVFNRVDR